LQENGVLALTASSTSLRFLPPMIWEQEQVDELITTLEKVLA